MGKICQQIQKSVLDMIQDDVITNICFVDHLGQRCRILKNSRFIQCSITAETCCRLCNPFGKKQSRTVRSLMYGKYSPANYNLPTARVHTR